VQSVPITTKVVSYNPVQDEVYSMQHYVIQFVSDLRQIGGFLRQTLALLRVSITVKHILLSKMYMFIKRDIYGRVQIV
jgi:hypothetical protein